MTSFGFSGVSFRVPMSWIGTALQGSAKKQFTMIRNKIDFYNICEIDSRNIVVILDLIESVKAEGYARSVPVLSEVIHYLRSLLLSSDTELVYHTLVLLDHIVKNSGFILHVMIGRRRFMKTMSHVARKHTAEIYYANKRVGNLALDCIQAWGEAFFPREEHYPHICRTYTKLKLKYKMRFPRPDFDPTRVPIFLDDVSRIEKAMAYSFNNEVELNYDRLEECKEEPREVNTAPTRMPQRTIPPLKPPRSRSTETNFDIPESKTDDSPDLIQFTASADMFPLSEQTAQPKDDVPGFVERYEDTYSMQHSASAALSGAFPGVAFNTGWPQHSPESAEERVMSLYPPSYSSYSVSSPPQPQGGTRLPPAQQQVSSPPPPLPPTHRQRPVQAATPWDLCDSASFQSPIAGIKSSADGAPKATAAEPGWRSNYMQPTSHHSSLASRNVPVSTSWDMASTVDLSKLVESLPVVREKKPQARLPLSQTNARASGAPRAQSLSVDAVGRLPSPRAAVSNVVVAEALAEFQLKMSSESSLPAYSPPPVPTAAEPPRVPPPPPPTPTTVSSPPAPSNGSVSVRMNTIESLKQVFAPAVPPVPVPPLDRSMVYEDLSQEEASPPRDPWSQFSFVSPPPVPSPSASMPPPVPALPPPTFAAPTLVPPSPPSVPDGIHSATEESGRMSNSSSEEDPISDLIQNLGASPLTAGAAPVPSSVPGYAMEALKSPSRVPRIPAPAPGPARPKRSDNPPPLMHFEMAEERQQTQLESPQRQPQPQPMPRPHLQQQQPHQRAKSAQLPTSKSRSFQPRVQSEDTESFERFDPTAGPKPVQPRKPVEPRKIGFTPPSSDPLNEIKYYGNQRVVVRRI